MGQEVSFRRRGRLPGRKTLFTPAQAREIRDRYRTGETADSLALIYEASNRTIRLILRGQTSYPLDPGEPAVKVRSSAEEAKLRARRNREILSALQAQGLTILEAMRSSGLSRQTLQIFQRETGAGWVPAPKRTVPVRHGTPAGYRRCGPPACKQCREANAARMREYWAARRRTARQAANT
jgi:hypothetical protein